MASTCISKRVVDAAQPTSTDIYLWDADLSGFGLKITPAGRKVYLIQYRLGCRRGRTRRITIGHHGELTPITARMEAKRLLGQVALGAIPQATVTRRGLIRVLAPCSTNSSQSMLSQSVKRVLLGNTSASPNFTSSRGSGGAFSAKSRARTLQGCITNLPANLTRRIARSRCFLSFSIGPKSMALDPITQIPAVMLTNTPRCDVSGS